jgi:uncharacterized protein (TIRG00374 family)
MLKKFRKLILLVLGVCAIGYFFYKFRNSITLEGFHWSMVGQSLRQARLSLLLLSVITIYGCYAVRALRWMRFSRSLGPSRFSNVFSATLVGFTCSFLLGRAGEPIRPVLIAKKDSLPVAGMFGVYVLERIFDVAATAVLAGFALLLFHSGGLATEQSGALMKLARSAGALLLVVLIVLLAFLIYFRYHGAAWLSRKLQHESWRTGWREKIAVLLEGFSDGLQGIRTWGDLGVLIAYSVLHWGLIIFVYLWVAHSFRGTLGTLTIAGATLVCAFTLVGSAVQLPGVGGGAQVASFLVFTLVFGVEKEAAATASIMLWLVGFAACCVTGLPLLFREGWTMGELRRMAQEEEKAGEAALLEEAEHAGESKETLR